MKFLILQQKDLFVTLLRPKQLPVFVKVTPLWIRCLRWTLQKFYFLCCHSCFLSSILIGQQKDEMGFFCLFTVFLNNSIYLIAANIDELINQLSIYTSPNKRWANAEEKAFSYLKSIAWCTYGKNTINYTKNTNKQ